MYAPVMTMSVLTTSRLIRFVHAIIGQVTDLAAINTPFVSAFELVSLTFLHSWCARACNYVIGNFYEKV